jgi:AcrR family transcriptional regulator
MMTKAAAEEGRYKQRRRTRAAIVAAAQELLESGKTPSMSDIAEAADVSRRTVYLHFPTLEQLLIDATLGALSQNAVDQAIEDADPGGTDASARVSAMIDTITSQAHESLHLGRSLIRLTVEQQNAEGEGVPRRGYRRVQWIEKAIEPLRERVTPEEFERLLSALAMVIGWEALIVLQDLRGLPADSQRETSIWAARALIDATLNAAAVRDGGPDVPASKAASRSEG